MNEPKHKVFTVKELESGRWGIYDLGDCLREEFSDVTEAEGGRL